MTETATGNIPGWRRTILLFLTSQCITLFGSTLVQMALVWYAAMETASGAWVAAFTVCPSSSSHFRAACGRTGFIGKCSS